MITEQTPLGGLVGSPQGETGAAPRARKPRDPNHKPDALTVARGIVRRFKDLPRAERCYVSDKIEEIMEDTNQ